MLTSALLEEEEKYSKTLVKKLYTIADIERLPEGKRAELIDGRIYMMSAPMRIHQDLISEINDLLRSHIRQKEGSCRVYFAPFAVYLKKDLLNYFEPDLVVVCDEKKLSDRGCEGAPDLVVEIVSKGTRKKDYQLKFAKYLQAGVREYWIIDPKKERSTVYYFPTGQEILESGANNPYEKYAFQNCSFEETFHSFLFPELAVNLAAFTKENYH